MSSTHVDNKHLVRDLLRDLSAAPVQGSQEVLDRYCAADCRWQAFAPFDDLGPNTAAAEQFWEPLARAMPGWTYRPGLMIAGDYAGQSWISTLGHVQGAFEADFAGIPPTWGLNYLRFGLNVAIRDGAVQAAYVLFDIIDLMGQAGFSPMRPMLGSAEQWPAPPPGTVPRLHEHDEDLGMHTLDLIREMQDGLGFGEEKVRAQSKLAGERADEHAGLPKYWSPLMNWYGSAGIGSMRGYWGYLRYHSTPFDRALPDFADYDDDPSTGHFGPPNTSHHYIQIGDGRAAVTSGWPSIIGTLSGPWLGLGPAHRPVAMRVADWYRLDAQDKIVDNWVMIDFADALRQAGLDIFTDLRYRVHPETPRWPRPVGTEPASGSAA